MAPGRRLSVFTMVDSSGDDTSDANYEGKKRKGRGVTRGLKVDKIVQYAGRIPIRFTPEQKEHVCENANNFSTKMGILVRQFAPLQVIDWSHMPEVEKSTLFYRLLAKFDVDLSLPHVYQYVNTTMGKLYSNNRCKMHKHFKSFQKVEDAILKPYTNVSKTDWLWLYEHFRSDKFQEEMQKLEGELTHNETPLTDVKIIERVLGPRSAYIKGFRKVHKTLMSSIPSSSTQQAEMIALKAELESTQEELKIAREKTLNT
ncbi:hypothetical protein Ddye_028605 [Dipteronia dyeriana]|uniref:Transposase, Ptta/En/Spm, plant n=1 Tax=Dipteronia dyeriana TaxID=168575 RepID=A0AAD9WKZ5_9ROSI|nr:hypothetical protein Ddye_028605 [Dipteronia dyeriana]